MAGQPRRVHIRVNDDSAPGAAGRLRGKDYVPPTWALDDDGSDLGLTNVEDEASAATRTETETEYWATRPMRDPADPGDQSASDGEAGPA
jgi:hypothetical protein